MVMDVSVATEGNGREVAIEAIPPTVDVVDMFFDTLKVQIQPHLELRSRVVPMLDGPMPRADKLKLEDELNLLDGCIETIIRNAPELLREVLAAAGIADDGDSAVSPSVMRLRHLLHQAGVPDRLVVSPGFGRGKKRTPKKRKKG
eukprot:UN2559